MPRHIPAETKREAIGMLQIHNDISLTHYLTGVHRRTLRRWREELGQRQNRFMSEKTFSSDITPAEDAISDIKSPHADQPHALADEQVVASEYENLAHFRDKLVSYARQVADGLSPDQPDANRRTLALARVLDRIQLLNQTLPELQPKERPPWQDALDALLELDISPFELAQVEEKANALDESLRARVYEYYRDYYAEKIRKKNYGLW